MVRDLQWGWKQEDFAENNRFLTGRDRKLSERQMKRETIMHGLEDDRLKVQKERQQEIWDKQDERWAMENRHHQEMLQYEIESMQKQREFYDVRKELEEESVKMQRAYWVQQQEFAKQQLGLQAAQLAQQKEYWEITTIAELAREERQIVFNERATAFLDLFGDGLETGYENLLKIMEVLGVEPKDADGLTADPEDSNLYSGAYASGGFIKNLLVGELGPEVISSNSLGEFVTPNNAINPWSGEVYTQKNTSSGNGKIELVLMVGNEHLKTIIVDTVSQEIQI